MYVCMYAHVHAFVHVCACAYGNYRLGVSCLCHRPPCFLRHDFSLTLLLVRLGRVPVISMSLASLSSTEIIGVGCTLLCAWVLGIRIYRITLVPQALYKVPSTRKNWGGGFCAYSFYDVGAQSGRGHLP